MSRQNRHKNNGLMKAMMRVTVLILYSQTKSKRLLDTKQESFQNTFKVSSLRMAISLVRFDCRGCDPQTLALYPGISETEVRRLLRSAFQLDSSFPLKQFSDRRGKPVTLRQVVAKPADFTELLIGIISLFILISFRMNFIHF
jgi:hypothetical protein